MSSTAGRYRASGVEFRPAKGIELPPSPPRGRVAWVIPPILLGPFVVAMTHLLPGWPWPAIARVGMQATMVALPIVTVWAWRRAMPDRRRLLTEPDGDAG